MPLPPSGQGGGRAGLIVLMVLLLAALGAGGAYVYLQSQEDDELSGAELEYAEAIADSNDADDQNTLTHEENLCLGTTYVTTLGLEAFQDRVSPQEIRDNPDDDHVDWGIDISQSQAEGIYDNTSECIDVPRWMARSIADEFESSDDQSVDCLTNGYGDHPMRAAMAASIIAGDDGTIEQQHAETIVAWLRGCIDLRADFIESLNEDGDMPEDVLACIDENLSAEAVEQVFAEAMASPEDTEAQDLESADEVFGVIEDCSEEEGVA